MTSSSVSCFVLFLLCNCFVLFSLLHCPLTEQYKYLLLLLY